MIGISPTVAWRILDRFRRKGLLKSAIAVRRAQDEVESIAYFVVRWDPGAVPIFEESLARDDNVRSVVNISGKFNYRIEASHSSLDLAKAWFHEIRQDPVVTAGELHLCRTFLDRPFYAAALLSQLERRA